MLYFLYLALFVSATVSVWKRTRQCGAGTATRVGHICFILFLVFVHFDPSRALAAALGIAIRPDFTVREFFAVDQGVVPESVALEVWILSHVSAVGILILAFAIARGKARARKRLLLWLPLVYLIDSYVMYVGVLAVTESLRGKGMPVFWRFEVLYAVLFGWVYVLMFWFYRSHKANAFFQEEPMAARECGE